MTTIRTRRGFTMLEFLVGLTVLGILVGIVVPYAVAVRERDRRTRCTDNLRKLGIALSQYATDHRYELPRVIADPDMSEVAYNAFTGPYSSNPFEPAGEVKPNDVTASLWLLIRGNYISSEFAPASAVFICPSTTDIADPITGRDGTPVGPVSRSNFAGPANLSYSYASPFSNAPDYGLKSDFIANGFALLADKNPGKRGVHQDATAPGVDATHLELSVANSPNHRRAGQNVLFGDMHVEFTSTPYCGFKGDNIYTAVAATPLGHDAAPQPPVRGHLGRQFGPASYSDSYLVPADGD